MAKEEKQGLTGGLTQLADLARSQKVEGNGGDEILSQESVGKKVCIILDDCCNKLDVLGKGFEAKGDNSDNGKANYWYGLAGFCKDLSGQILNASSIVDDNNL